MAYTMTVLLRSLEDAREKLVWHWFQVVMPRQKQRLRVMMSLFPDRFYLELQRTNRADEEDYIHAAVTLAEHCDCPVVATNDVRFIESSEFEAHERVCIYEGRALDDPRRERRYSESGYLRAPGETELFSDIPEALENTVEIAKRCNVDLKFGEYFLPDYPIPEGMTIDEFLVQVSEGLDNAYTVYLISAVDYPAKREAYYQRLKFELDIIIQMGFPGYFLIVMDFIGQKTTRYPLVQGVVLVRLTGSLFVKNYRS